MKSSLTNVHSKTIGTFFNTLRLAFIVSVMLWQNVRSTEVSCGHPFTISMTLASVMLRQKWRSIEVDYNCGHIILLLYFNDTFASVMSEIALARIEDPKKRPRGPEVWKISYLQTSVPNSEQCTIQVKSIYMCYFKDFIFEFFFYFF